MGATSLHREPGQSDAEFFTREFPEMLTQRGRIVASATVPDRHGDEWTHVFYAAVEKQTTGEVWALVVYMHKGTGRYNFTYKECDETMGVAATCPLRVLDHLTRTDNLTALAWRQACREHAAKQAMKPGRVTVGMRVRFATAFTFADNQTEDTFIKVKYGHRNDIFRRADSGDLVRLPAGWRQLDFQQVS